MTSHANIYATERPAEIPTVHELKSYYKLTSLELLKCGQHIPGEDSLVDQEMADKEVRLLSRQDDILDNLASLEIKSPEDASLIAHLWMDIYKSEDSDLPSNRLALALCRYIQKQ